MWVWVEAFIFNTFTYFTLCVQTPVWMNFRGRKKQTAFVYIPGWAPQTKEKVSKFITLSFLKFQFPFFPFGSEAKY